MKKHTYSFLFYALSLFLLTGVTNSTPKEQKVKVTLDIIHCRSVDDPGGDEDLYGKIWALNLTPYKSVDYAKAYFNQNKIHQDDKSGGGKIWSTDRNHLLFLKKDGSQSFKKSIVLNCVSTDKIIVIGDLNERDKGNPDDKLMSAGSIEYQVLKLSDSWGVYLVYLMFKSGGTDVWAYLTVEKL